jgi:hypothetical protein
MRKALGELIMTRFSTTEVFTPATVARVTFVERKEANRRLVNALRTPGKQIVVYGRSGSGKTTLLENKLHQTYSRHIKSQCMADTTFEQLLLSAFDQLEPFFTSERLNGSATTREIGIEGQTAIKRVAEIRFHMGRKIEEKSEATSSRMVPPQLNPPLLAQLLGESQACWVIEDLHKAPDDTRKLVAQMMKLFMDAADKSADVRVIVLGAVGSARDIVQLDKDMWNRVADIEVGLMSPVEIEEIIRLGEDALNIQFPDVVKKNIVHYANGLGAVCHQICLTMCQDAEINETCDEKHIFTEEAFATALGSWVADATEALRQSYDLATRTERARRYDNCQLIIQALSSFSIEGATHPQILAKIRDIEPAYPSGNLSGYLTELQSSKRGEVVLYDDASGRYFFASPMLGAYARAVARRSEEDVQQRLPLRESLQSFRRNFTTELFTENGPNWVDVFTTIVDSSAERRIVTDESVRTAKEKAGAATKIHPVKYFLSVPKPGSKK